MTVFLDMDGVLVNFFEAAVAHHGATLAYEDATWDFPKQIGFPSSHASEFWDPLGREFWANLDWTPEGRDILQIVEGYAGDNIVLVTSPCRTPGCMDGKRDWVARHMPDYIDRLCLCRAKHLLAAPDKILVDDHDENLRKFGQNNGWCVTVPRPWNSMDHNDPALAVAEQLDKCHRLASLYAICTKP